MIKSFLKAMIPWTRGRMGLLHTSVIGIRWGICKNCPHKRKSWFRYYCDLCKCTISPLRHFFNKLAHPCEQCPIMNWTQIYGIGCPPVENNYAVEQEQSTCFNCEDK